MSDLYNENNDIEEEKNTEDLTSGHKDASTTAKAGKSDNSEYEDVCFICRRPESKTGKCSSFPTIFAYAMTVCTKQWRR